MKRFMKIVFKVVFSIILLFLCLAFKPHEARAEFFNGGIFADDDEFLDFSEDEPSTIETVIENENGGLFESTIAKALGGIAEAVFNITTSNTINLGFKNYDELIFNKTIYEGLETEEISPFNSYTWNKMMQWYKVFTLLAFIPILIGAIVTSYKFIIAGTNVTRRNEAKDSLSRLALGGVAIALAPIFVKLLLMINANMVSALVSTTTGGLNDLLGNSIFSQIRTGSAIATALVICLFAYLFIKFNIKFIVRKFTLIVFTVFTPIIAGMWIINKNVTGAAIWFGQILINVFMQFVYAFLFLIYMDFTSAADGWAVSLLWAMMILPLGDVLLNTMQNLVSRIAGINNENLSNRGIGMGATMAYTVRSIGAQFTSNNTTKSNVAKRVGGAAYGVGRSILNTGMFLAEGRNISPKGPITTRRNTEIVNTEDETLIFINNRMLIQNKFRSHYETWDSMAQLNNGENVHFSSSITIDKNRDIPNCKEKIKVYYTNTPFHKIKKANANELQQIIDKSHLICESK